MSEIAARSEKVAAAFTARVEVVRADAWERPAPRAGWVARDVVRHLVPDWETRRPGVVFDVEDIEGTCAQLAANGVAFDKPLADMPWGANSRRSSTPKATSSVCGNESPSA